MSTAGPRNVWPSCSYTLPTLTTVPFALSFVHPFSFFSRLSVDSFVVVFFIWLADTQVRCEKRTFFSNPSSDFTPFFSVPFLSTSLFYASTFCDWKLFAHTQRSLTCEWWSSCPPPILAPAFVSWLPCEKEKENNNKNRKWSLNNSSLRMQTSSKSELLRNPSVFVDWQKVCSQ
jgi:hypothetical protein